MQSLYVSVSVCMYVCLYVMSAEHLDGHFHLDWAVWSIVIYREIAVQE